MDFDLGFNFMALLLARRPLVCSTLSQRRSPGTIFLGGGSRRAGKPTRRRRAPQNGWTRYRFSRVPSLHKSTIGEHGWHGLLLRAGNQSSPGPLVAWTYTTKQQRCSCTTVSPGSSSSGCIYLPHGEPLVLHTTVFRKHLVQSQLPSG